MKKLKKGITFGSYLKKKLKDSEFSVAYEEASMHLKIAVLIEELRHKKGLTQAQLAKLAGVSQSMIARLEKGDQDRTPTLSTVNKVLSALGYTVDLVFKEVA